MLRLRHATAVVFFTGFQCLVASGLIAGTADNQVQEAVWPTKAWPVSTPEEQGMQSGTLARLVETVGGYKQDSLLIVRHGKIVLDAYYAPYQPNITHDLRSVTKSVVSTLTAIEIKQGLLDSVDHPIMDLFADKQIPNIDEAKKAMTVQHLLDMTSGLEWQEKSYTPDETLMRMYQAPDRTAFVLSQPMSDAPGAKFYYNSGNPYVLSALINRKTGQNALDFAEKELFGPLGITSARWGRADAQGVIDGEAGLSLAPHDMARFGYLYLRNGMWDGKQIIPASWVDRAREGRVKATFGFRYANLWWSLPEKDAYMARGRHSQLILVLPKLDIVAVMTGILRDDQFYPTARLIDDIASAVKSDQPLPPDAVAQSLLAASVREAATERPSPLGKTPELAKQISGKTYQVSSNILRVKTFALNLVDPDPFWEITTYAGRADQPAGRFSGLLGLDGIFRKSPPVNYGINASKGRWLDERTFALERRILGRSETQLWILAFNGNKVEVAFENTDGTKATLYGEVKE
ncbi:CubicO group peptidase (beta-lactamase class C family) [Bradyrhizobium sp. AZCC 1578]|uniref:serine hydrolase domain-containing protein n=1 Tax=Bradyrhizobium sp. AZCC 1578 TaxID=3117027 RepID=UPI002FF06445